MSSLPLGGCGLIPARAGRTAQRTTDSVSSSAHPRSRGADVPQQCEAAARRGSSPLARGGQPFAERRRQSGGLIPARAGRTRFSAWICSRRWAHPRSRGADAAAHALSVRARGSSPLARGGPCPSLRGSFRCGLIPARAGRTGASPTVHEPAWAHPRSRGADIRTHAEVEEWQGSSPLARGGLSEEPLERGDIGLIPARAGRTSGWSAPQLATRAHPRSRGADRAPECERGVLSGSSPLARGGQYREYRAQLYGGLIPARAGRTRGSRVRGAA